MSTAIMHQSALYDFGDLLMKNQTHSVVHSMGGGSGAVGGGMGGGVGMGPNGWTEHPALARAASLPAQRALGVLLDRIGQHRRLERTVSEPAAAPAPAQPALSPSHTSRYKTELCRPFEEAGVCKYGDKCQFAHGFRELRNLQRHPKYKTELCRTFHSVGFCPYGPRCHFVHNAEEARRRDPPSPGGSLASLSSGSFASSGGSGSGSGAGSQYDGSRSPHSPHSPESPRSPPALSPPAFAFRRARSPDLPPATSPHDAEEARLPVFNRLSAFGDLIIA